MSAARGGWCSILTLCCVALLLAIATWDVSRSISAVDQSVGAQCVKPPSEDTSMWVQDSPVDLTKQQKVFRDDGCWCSLRPARPSPPP